MPNNDDYVKTPKGLEELSNRKYKLPQKLRTMLILIHGPTPAQELLEQGVKLGVPTGFIEELESQGFIAKVGNVQPDQVIAQYQPVLGNTPEDIGKRFILAKEFLNISAVNSLGLRAFFFTLKLEKCSSLEDLRNLLPSYSAAIAKTSGQVVADIFNQKANVLLR